MADIPTQEEVLSYFDKLSNWGRWGRDDELGTLNLITQDKRCRAASLVRDGETVSCSQLIPRSQPLTPGPVLCHMVQSGERYALGDLGDDPNRLQWSAEWLGFSFHGRYFTHVDSLSHVFRNGKMYNDRSAALVKTYEGATVESIDVLRDGIVTRGVLLDVARVKGKEWLDASEPVMPSDLEEAEQAQNVRVEEGDVLFLRTGYLRQLAELKPGQPQPAAHSGYQAACCPWFYERGVAMIGSDVINDATPSPYPRSTLPVHEIALVAMGLWLIDNAALERLSEVCAHKNRWDFMLVIAPLRIQNGTGSPVNPIAIF